jgi:hypothetical protein
MGERYNPYSLIAPSKNRTGRNYVGDLFKHWIGFDFIFIREIKKLIY